MKYSARELSLAGLFGALGVVIPILFHMVGLGRAFLPMHLPVLVCGLLVSPTVAFVTGFVTPIVSSALTGMPPMIPTAALMTLELGTLAAAASVLRRTLRLPTLASVVGAIVLARVVGGLETLAIAPLMDVRQSITVYLAASVAASWPGLLLQLIAAPSVIAAIDRGHDINNLGKPHCCPHTVRPKQPINEHEQR